MTDLERAQGLFYYGVRDILGGGSEAVQLGPTVEQVAAAFAEVRREAETKMSEARDEIVKLRKALHAEMMGRPDKWHAFIAEARAEALEDAARVADGYCTDRTDDVAAAIRALKGTAP